MACSAENGNRRRVLCSAADWLSESSTRAMKADVPTVSRRAIVHVMLARSAAERSVDEVALQEYRVALQKWWQAEEAQPGAWSKELHLTNREYASVLRGKFEKAADMCPVHRRYSA
jgi:hypothetical protein